MSAVSLLWQAFALRPRPVDEFELSPTPQFSEKVSDRFGLYSNPPDGAVVLCR